MISCRAYHPVVHNKRQHELHHAYLESEKHTHDLSKSFAMLCWRLEPSCSFVVGILNFSMMEGSLTMKAFTQARLYHFNQFSISRKSQAGGKFNACVTRKARVLSVVIIGVLET